jgi:uncharacterized protein
MLFVVVGRFKPGVQAQTEELRSAFSDHLASNQPRIRLGGPLKDDSGARTGVFYVAEATSLDSIRHFVNSSPYVHAELYERLDIDELTLEAGRLE